MKIILFIKILTLFLIPNIICSEYFSSDPDIDRNSSQIIESRGFIPESHDIITDDGYILTVFRIRNPHWNGPKPYPIYIQHGFLQNSDNWLITRPGILDSNGAYSEDNFIINNCLANGSAAHTLPFVLSSCGYDVWVGNIRGNIYSSHLFLDQNKDMNYWNFSIDDFTRYDLIAVIDHVLRVTNRESLGYIGYSLGTTMMFQLLSAQPNYSKMIKPFIALAPFVYLGHIVSPLLRNSIVLEPIFNSNPKPLARFGSISPLIGRYFCGYSMLREICVVFNFLFGGFDYPQLNRTLIPRLFAHFPDSTSSIAVSHTAQRIKSQNFSYYNYNSSETNRKIYGKEFAPNYDISRVDSKYIYIMNGMNDWIASPTDVDILISRLNVPVRRYVVPYSHWTHGDFMSAIDVGKYINKPILEILRSLQL